MFNRRHRLGLRVAAVAALALFGAQLGAVAHAYTHAPSTATPSAFQQIQKGHEFCSDCLNLAYKGAKGGSIDSAQFNFSADDLAAIASRYIHLDNEQQFTASGGVS